jgi:aminoglycoside phosphotransferase (APT) family kinase protein
VEFTSTAHGPHDIRQALTPDEVQAACERAFGHDIVVESAHEMSGGAFNSTYLIHLAGRAPVVLRVAPPPGCDLPWHEAHLMRHEHAILPYLASIAPLMPTTLMIDFTHLVLPRDYLLQSFMPGEQWKGIADQLSPQDEERLWRELARILQTIHGVEGEAFGVPDPARQFPTWSATVLDWLARSLADAQRAGLDTENIQRLRELAQARPDLLDEISVPRLLHGDLWPVNILVERGERGESGESGESGERGARISAVLDSDRVSWGDPLADWTFYLLPRRTTERIQAIFWDEYGARETTLGARFRAGVYEGLHISNVLSDMRRNGRMDLEPQSQGELRAIVAALQAMR